MSNRTGYARGVRLTAEAPASTIVVREGEVVFMLRSGQKPMQTPIEEAGEWEVDAMSVDPNPRWPIIVLAVRKGHAKAFGNMTLEQVDSLVRGTDRDRGGER